MHGKMEGWTGIKVKGCCAPFVWTADAERQMSIRCNNLLALKLDRDRASVRVNRTMPRVWAGACAIVQIQERLSE